MKILHVINVRWFNATAWYALTLAKLQKQHGHDVRIITIKGTDTDTKAKALGFTPLYINLTTSNPITLIRSFYQLRSLIASFKPDIINCHRGEAFILFSWLSLFYPFALIRTRGDQRVPKKNWVNTLLHKYCADAIISTNTKMTTILESSFGLEQGSVYTILGGVDVHTFVFSHEGRERIRTLYNIQEDECLLGVLGRLDWVKGQKEIIKSVATIIQKENIKIKLLLIGFSAGIEQEEVERWIREHAMEEIIYVTGKCDNVVDYISSLDIAILSSLGSETIARAALEIMSCNIPLLATNVGVMPDLISEELLMKLPDTEEDIIALFASAIIEHVHNKERREALITAQQKSMPQLTEEYFYEVTQSAYTNARKKKMNARKICE